MMMMIMMMMVYNNCAIMRCLTGRLGVATKLSSWPGLHVGGDGHCHRNRTGSRRFQTMDDDGGTPSFSYWSTAGNLLPK